MHFPYTDFDFHGYAQEKSGQDIKDKESFLSSFEQRGRELVDGEIPNPENYVDRLIFKGYPQGKGGDQIQIPECFIFSYLDAFSWHVEKHEHSEEEPSLVACLTPHTFDLEADGKMLSQQSELIESYMPEESLSCYTPLEQRSETNRLKRDNTWRLSSFEYHLYRKSDEPSCPQSLEFVKSPEISIPDNIDIECLARHIEKRSIRKDFLLEFS
jgi:hypothetical protein